MPEGHLLHRYAGQMRVELAGRAVRAGSPQGRLDTAPLDGRVLADVQAWGKHLLQHFEDGPTVHVHLGMRGTYLRYEDPAEPPRSGVRLRLAGATAWDLIAPMTCELLDDSGAEGVTERLGPDPLRPDADEQEAVRRLLAAGGAVAVAVVDQAVWAGVGNAWRAELLWLERLDPRTPVHELGEDGARALWRRAVGLMALGRDAGQVVSDPSAPDERWVYKRDTCRSCGDPVRVEQLGGRTSYACPVEQVRPGPVPRAAR